MIHSAGRLTEGPVLAVSGSSQHRFSSDLNDRFREKQTLPFLVNLIEQAFIEGQIDGETQELAYTCLEVNHPCGQ